MTRNQTLLSLLFVTLAGACGASAAATDSPEPEASGPALIARAADLSYRPCAAPLPEGCEIAVLEGNPAQAGLFTVRIRAAGPIFVAPHRHPATSRVTVLSGTLNVGFQETVDKSAALSFEAGDYYVNTGAAHFVWTDGPAVLQLTGTGPWTSTPADNHSH